MNIWDNTFYRPAKHSSRIWRAVRSALIVMLVEAIIFGVAYVFITIGTRHWPH